jgi:putative ABC transport system ATP-binding protein
MAIAASLRNINKDFHSGEFNIRVLHDISLEINMGQLTMLVGPSGCGKTTLISIITGILSATNGEVVLIDKSLNDIDDNEKVLLRRNSVGFIFQQYNLLPALTAAENAAMPLLAANMDFKKAVNIAKETLKRVGLESQTEKLPNQLSGGQQQRVAIARALVHKPKIIVCDEPTAALDANSGRDVMNILRDIANDQDRAVLIVTHDNRIFNSADRIIEISDGRIIGDYNAAEFIKKEKN